MPQSERHYLSIAEKKNLIVQILLDQTELNYREGSRLKLDPALFFGNIPSLTQKELLSLFFQLKDEGYIKAKEFRLEFEGFYYDPSENEWPSVRQLLESPNHLYMIKITPNRKNLLRVMLPDAIEEATTIDDDGLFEFAETLTDFKAYVIYSKKDKSVLQHLSHAKKRYLWQLLANTVDKGPVSEDEARTFVAMNLKRDKNTVTLSKSDFDGLISTLKKCSPWSSDKIAECILRKPKIGLTKTH